MPKGSKNFGTKLLNITRGPDQVTEATKSGRHLFWGFSTIFTQRHRNIIIYMYYTCQNNTEKNGGFY